MGRLPRRQLRQAMESRAIIEQAKGMIMMEQGCTASEAFAVLTRAAKRRRHKLREVAAAMVQQAMAGGGTTLGPAATAPGQPR